MALRPLVSVLMSVHDELRFLPEAVESVLAQTFTDFEFVIYDDASSDGTTDYLMGLRDRRLRLFRNEERVGPARSLNRGLDQARGEYVARMDAAAVALPGRLGRQVTYLEENLDVGILGSSRIVIDDEGDFAAASLATPDDLNIRWRCLLGEPFAAPTVMLRRRVLDAHGLRFDETFHVAPDHELCARVLPRTRGVNLTEPLLRERLRMIPAGVAEPLADHDRAAHAAIRHLVPDFRIRPEGVTELRGRYAGRDLRDPEMDPGDPRWLACYLDLLDAFLAAHADEDGIDAFRHRQLAGLAAAGLAEAV